MNDLNDLYFFVQSVEHGGFAPAARALEMQKSKLSRRIAALEERLGARLIERSTRRFAMTELGRQYFERCKTVVQAAEAAEQLCRVNETKNGRISSVYDASAPAELTSPIPSPAGAAEPVQRRHEQVQNFILEGIRSGHLVPGDKLPAERELAASLGIARQAVREAIRSLEMSGVLRLELGANRGVFVRETGPDGIAYSIRNMLILGRLPLTDLLEARASLLGQAARLAARRGTPDDFDLIERNVDLLERCIAAGDQMGTIAPATDFYRLTIRASHNPLMILLVDAMAKLVEEMLTVMQTWPAIDGLSPRRDMLAAMRAGQGEAAERIIRLHCEETNALLLDYRPLIDGALRRVTS